MTNTVEGKHMMQLSLAIAVPALAPAPKTPGQIYKTLWDSYRKTLTGFLRGMDALRTQEKALLRYRESYESQFQEYYFSMKTTPEDVMKGIAKSLVRKAEEAFHPEGGTLNIPETDYLNRYVFALSQDENGRRLDRPNLARFDPEGLWVELETNYGGEAGVREGHRQTAQRLFKFFGLQPGAEPETKGPFTLLNLRVWIDSIDQKYSKVNRLSHGCLDRVCGTLTGLAAFASWAGFPELERNANRTAHHIWGPGREIVSRQKTELGNGVCLTTYKERFEFRFDPKAVESLQMYLGTFLHNGSDMEEAA